MAGHVLDASAVVELLRRTPAGGRVAALIRGSRLAAPAHLDAEVLGALTRLARQDPAEVASVSTRLDVLAGAPIIRYACAPLLAEAWTMRDNIAARDALYVALARRLGARLVTADARLGRAPATALRVDVDLVASN